MQLSEWLTGVALDVRTYLWLRRRIPGLVAQRLVNGYRIIGLLAEGE